MTSFRDIFNVSDTPLTQWCRLTRIDHTSFAKMEVTVCRHESDKIVLHMIDFSGKMFRFAQYTQRHVAFEWIVDNKIVIRKDSL